MHPEVLVVDRPEVAKAASRPPFMPPIVSADGQARALRRGSASSARAVSASSVATATSFFAVAGSWSSGVQPLSPTLTVSCELIERTTQYNTTGLRPTAAGV